MSSLVRCLCTCQAKKQRKGRKGKKDKKNKKDKKGRETEAQREKRLERERQKELKEQKKVQDKHERDKITAAKRVGWGLLYYIITYAFKVTLHFRFSAL